MNENDWNDLLMTARKEVPMNENENDEEKPAVDAVDPAAVEPRDIVTITVNGRVHRFYADNGQPAPYGQPI